MGWLLGLGLLRVVGTGSGIRIQYTHMLWRELYRYIIEWEWEMQQGAIASQRPAEVSQGRQESPLRATGYLRPHHNLSPTTAQLSRFFSWNS